VNSIKLWQDSCILHGNYTVGGVRTYGVARFIIPLTFQFSLENKAFIDKYLFAPDAFLGGFPLALLAVEDCSTLICSDNSEHDNKYAHFCL
jgi:hypothetical protein